MTRGERAEALFKEGYNCAQAVLLAFSDVTGLDEKTAALISSSFGGGMGRLREVCGSLSGAFAAVGILRGYSDPKDTEKKKELYALIQEIAAEFKEENGSIICRELLGLDKDTKFVAPSHRSDEYYKKRPCPELCACTAGILARYLEEHPEKDEQK